MGRNNGLECQRSAAITWERRRLQGQHPFGEAQFQLIKGGRGGVLGQGEVIGSLLIMDQEFNGYGEGFVEGK